MKLEKHLTVQVTDGDLQLRAGRELTTFAYKGVDKFVFRTAEIEPLIAMLQAVKRELENYEMDDKN